MERRRTRPAGRAARFVLEYSTPEERALVDRVKAQARRRGLYLRQWALAALREQLEREGGDERAAKAVHAGAPA